MFDGGALISRARLANESTGQRPKDQRGPAQHAEPGDTADAAKAICSFLAGFGLEPERHSDLVHRLVAGTSATETAVEHAERQLEAWLALVLGPEILAGQPALPIGRAAFLACDGPSAWDHLLLVHDGLPEVFVAAMRAAAPSPAPMPMPGTMAAQPLESWSIADARRAVLSVLDGPLGWAANSRPLRIASIKLTRPS